jgi:benzoylsuccinyl-CoA thiolase BbsB subunit
MSSGNAFVAGVGMVPFRKWATRSLESLGREAVMVAIADAGVDKSSVNEVFCGSSYGGPLVGQRILRDLGMTGPAITNVENACSSGSSAIREGVAAIAMGRAETVLVIGVDKLSGFGGGTLPLESTDLDVGHGMVMPAVYAMRARQYMHKFGAEHKHLAMVTVKARQAAQTNEFAQYRTPVSVEDVLGSRMVADPLTLFMCCPTGDGAAAVVLTTAARMRQLGRPPLRIAASVLQSGRYETGPRDISRAEITERTARLAFEQAGLGPGDLDMAEIHDAFAIAELMYCEALGLCGEGEAKGLLERGETSIGGRIPVNPSGGLICRGHPVGATGVAQLVEAAWQIREEAGPRQIDGCRVALTHCTGGGISGLDHGACSIHIVVR